MPKNLGLYDSNLSVPRKQDVDLVNNELEQLTQDFDEHIGNFNNPHQVTKTQIGLSNVANILQYSSENPPPYPVTSVNSQTGAVNLTASSIGALPTQTGAQGQFLGFVSQNTVGAVDAPTGVDIQISSAQPPNQKTGDFWYQIV